MPGLGARAVPVRRQVPVPAPALRPARRRPAAEGPHRQARPRRSHVARHAAGACLMTGLSPPHMIGVTGSRMVCPVCSGVIIRAPAIGRILRRCTVWSITTIDYSKSAAQHGLLSKTLPCRAGSEGRSSEDRKARRSTGSPSAAAAGHTRRVRPGRPRGVGVDDGVAQGARHQGRAPRGRGCGAGERFGCCRAATGARCGDGAVAEQAGCCSRRQPPCRCGNQQRYIFCRHPCGLPTVDDHVCSAPGSACPHLSSRAGVVAHDKSQQTSRWQSASPMASGLRTHRRSGRRAAGAARAGDRQRAAPRRLVLAGLAEPRHGAVRGRVADPRGTTAGSPGISCSQQRIRPTRRPAAAAAGSLFDAPHAVPAADGRRGERLRSGSPAAGFPGCARRRRRHRRHGRVSAPPQRRPQRGGCRQWH